MTSIYDLQLNESVEEEDFKITRVPGGWIYLKNLDGGISTVFVPFHNEFDFKKRAPEIR
jgi:hypothetical protein